MRKYLGLIWLLFPLIAWGGPCEFGADRVFWLSSSTLSLLDIDMAGADIRIEGVAGLTHVEVNGKACASNAKWRDGLDIGYRQDGERIMLERIRPRELSFDVCPMAGAEYPQPACYAYVDVRLRVPLNLPLRIDNVGGKTVAQHIAALDFISDSGDLTANHVAGAVTLNLDSGEYRHYKIKADDVGSITLRNTDTSDSRSMRTPGYVGVDVSLSHVRGNIKATELPDINLNIANVDGDVLLDKISSGNMIIKRIKGDFAIGATGTGFVHVDGVGGNFSVSTKGGGEIRQRNVGGRVEIARVKDH